MTKIIGWLLNPFHILGIVLAMFSVYWLFNGHEILTFKPDEEQIRILSDFKKNNPKAANWIAQQQDHFGLLNTAVAIDSLNGKIANNEVIQEEIQARARLAAIYKHDQMNDESVLWAHGTAIEALDSFTEEKEEYLQTLEDAVKDKDYWSLVRNDPIALTSKLLKVNPGMRKDYIDNQTWYQQMLEVLVSSIEINNSTDEKAEDITSHNLDTILEVANECKPYLMQIIPNPEESPLEACIYFEAFRQFGKAISQAAKEGIPANEIIEVIIMNRNEFLNDDEELNGGKIKDPTKLAAELITIYRNKPSVWAAAKIDAYVWTLERIRKVILGQSIEY